MIVQVISGGQTGADRAALDWAIAHGYRHGGWCPKGRRAEDGVIPDRYQLTETPSAAYEQRTEWNVRDSDGTIVFSIAPVLTGGSKRTLAIAHDLRKPYLHIYHGLNAGVFMRDFIDRHRIAVLNVAGPRASSEPEVASFVNVALSAALLNRPLK